MAEQETINQFGESWNVIFSDVTDAPRIKHMPHLYSYSIGRVLGRSGTYSTKEEALNQVRELKSINVDEVLKFIDDKIANTEKLFGRIKIKFIKISPSREQLLLVRYAYLNMISADDNIKVKDLPNDLGFLPPLEIGTKVYILNISRNTKTLLDSIGFKEFEISGYSIPSRYAIYSDRYSPEYSIEDSLKDEDGTKRFTVLHTNRTMNSYNCRSIVFLSKAEVLQYLENFEKDIAAIKPLL